jgi:hypothetical protein
MTLIDEIRNHYDGFRKDWQDALSSRIAALPNSNTRFENSYIRLTSLQAWRSNIIEPQLTTDSIGFFIEAQNDALISHIQASLGSWRVALKSLRSCIENVLLCLYYKDHPVEFSLWEIGKFRIPFSKALKYLQDHPCMNGLPDHLTGLSLINKEYDKLSQAVHSSSIEFRMTEDGKALSLWKTDAQHESIWETREKRTLEGLNLLLLAFFKGHLQGSNLGALRESIGFVIPATKDATIKSSMGVRIKR